MNATLQQTLRTLQELSEGTISHELEALTLKGLQSGHAETGCIRCSFIIPSHLSDSDGNWHAGAIATLIDDVGAAAIYSVVKHVKISVDLSISFYSTAKIREEVEIEAKVIGEKRKLLQVVVEIRRKLNRDLIVVGRQWMVTPNKNAKPFKISRI